MDELPETDPRLHGYQRSRIMAPLADPATGVQLRRRRHDVCWIDRLRLDLTDATGRSILGDDLTYQRAPLGTVDVTVTLDEVASGYPAIVKIDGSAADHLLVTARGYSTGVLRAGDRLRLRCSQHSSLHSTFLSLDDAAGHSIELLPSEDKSW